MAKGQGPASLLKQRPKRSPEDRQLRDAERKIGQLTLIDFMQDRGKTRARIAAMTQAGDDIALCAVTVAELHSGVSEKHLRLFNDWLGSLPYWHITQQAAEQAGRYRKAAAVAGKTLHIPDCLLAACARETGATVLTSNSKDFEFMQDVSVMSLRESVA